MRFELEHYQDVTLDETIEALSFAAPEGERVQSSSISNKTSRVAMIYRKVNERWNLTSRQELERKIAANELELMKLECCLERLEIKVRGVIKDIYLNRLTWNEACERYYISEKTLSRYRKKGIEALASMFAM